MAVVAAVGLYLRRRTLQHVPLWVDEAWVADSVKASPLRSLWMSFPGPPVWQMALRVVYYGSNIERLRILPFLFSIGALAPAYLLGRRLGKGYGLVCAAVMALLPWAVYRQDLKQYTAEAFVALCLVLAGTHLESKWDVRRMIGYAIVAAAIVLFAETAVFVNAAVIGALALDHALRRRWRRVGAVALLGAGVVGTNMALLKWLQSQGSRNALRQYWATAFIPTGRGLGTATRFADHRIREALEGLGLAWWIALPVSLLGIVVLWRRGMRTAALAGPLILGAMVAGATRRLYPLLDKRTSLFLVALFAVELAVGIGWILGLFARRRWTVPIALGLAIACAWSILPAALRQSQTSVPFENVRDETSYVRAHRGPNDVILVGYAASFGFAAYYPERPTFVRSHRPETTLAFRVTYPGDPSIAIAPWRAHADELLALDSALATARLQHGRLWLVVSHDRPDDWAALFPAYVDAQRIGSLHLGGGDAVFVLTFRRA